MRFPYFMFWPERYWLDTYDLSDAEHGRYLRLLILMWNTPRCRIPNDPAWVASKTGRSVQAFESEIKPMLLRFCKTDGRSWWQAKLLAEYERCERLASRGSAGGKALAKKKKDMCQTPASDMKQAHAPTSTSTSTSTKSLSSSLFDESLFKEESIKEVRISAERSSGWNFDEFWTQFPNKVGKGRARVEFENVRKKKHVEFSALMLGVMRYSAKTDDRPWCNPATWLHQERWTDEPAQGGANGRSETLSDRAQRLAERARELESEDVARRETPAF